MTTERTVPPTNLPVGAIPNHNPLGGLTERLRAERDSRTFNRSMDIAALTGAPLDQASEAAQSEYETGRIAAEVAPSADYEGTVGNAIAENRDPWGVVDEIWGADERIQAANSYGDLILQQAYAFQSPHMTAAEGRLTGNVQILTEMLREEFQSLDERTYAGMAWDFLDEYLLTHFPFGLYDDVTNRGQHDSAEVHAAASNMDAREFTAWAEAWVAERRSEGIFNDNYFVLQEALRAAETSGYDLQSRVDQAWGVFEALTGGVSGVSRLTAGRRITAELARRGQGPASRAAAVAGVEAADTTTEGLIAAGAHRVPEVVDDNTMGPLALGRDPSATVGRTFRSIAIVANNPLLSRIRHLYSQGVFGVAATAEEIDQVAQATVARVNRHHDNPVMDIQVLDESGLGEHSVRMVIGRPVLGLEDGGGLPFRTADAAQAFADDLVDEGFAVSVRAVNGEDPTQGFHVIVDQRLDVSTVASPVELGEVSENILSQLFGRASSVDRTGGVELAIMGESGFSQFAAEVQPYLNTLQALGYDSRRTLSNILENQRDGSHSFMTRNYTDSEFSFQWREATGRAPTEQEMEAFHAFITLSDTAYVLQANRIVQRYVVNGYQAVSFAGFRSPARVIARVSDESAPVRDAATGNTIPAGRLRDDATIWELENPAGDVRYVVNPDVSTLRYDDVLGYRPGGRRDYMDMNYILQLGDNALMTAFSEGAVVAARNALRAVQAEVRRVGLPLRSLTNELDGVLAANRGWHHGIENTEDFVAWIRREGIEETFEEGEIASRAKDDVIDGQQNPLWNGSTHGERAAVQRSRRNTPLTEVGGGRGRTFSPVRSVTDQLNDVATEFSFRASNQRAKTAWLRRAMGGQKLPEGTDINAAFRNTPTPTAGGQQNRKLRALRQVIERRENTVGPIARRMEDFGDKMMEHVFDLSGGRLKWRVPRISQLQNSLLMVGFHSAFGFLNISQFALQASHAGAIVAISPKHGLRAASMVLPIRTAMNMPAGEMRDLAVRNLSRASGMSVEQIEDYWTLLRSSGRDLVDGSAAELNTGGGFGISGYNGQNLLPSHLNRLLVASEGVRRTTSRASTLFFNEGERLSRHTGILTAVTEYMERNPGKSILTPEGRAWISAREQVLGGHMTTASRGAWQTGVMRIPTQWFSYSMRMLENIFLGSEFSAMERIRLATWLTISGGLSGWFLGSTVDSLGQWLGTEPGGYFDVGLRYGVIDMIMSWGLSEATDSDIRTAIGTRLAPFTAFSEMYRTITEENAWSALAGPSGEIAGGAFEALLSTAGGVLSGNLAVAQQDLERLLRTPGGINNLFTAEGIINHGIYQGRTGTVLPMEFSDVEGWLQVAGVTNFRVAEFYARRTRAFREQRELRDYRTNMQRRWREGIRIYQDGDRESGLQLMREVNAAIAVSGFSPSDQMALRRALRQDTENDLTMMIIEHLRDEARYGAQVLESLR